MTEVEKKDKRIAELEEALKNAVSNDSKAPNNAKQPESEGIEEDPKDVLKDEIAYMSINAIQGRRTQRQLQRLSEIGVLEDAVKSGSAYQKRYARSQLRWMAR